MRTTANPRYNHNHHTRNGGPTTPVRQPTDQAAAPTEGTRKHPPDDAVLSVLHDMHTQAEQRARQELQPEFQLILALLNMTAAAAREVLALVDDDDIDDYMARWTLRWIRAVVARGEDPTPQAVLIQAHRPDPGHTPTREPSPSRQRAESYLIRVYTSTTRPTAWPMARQVVEDSYLREIYGSGIRLAQMAAERHHIPDILGRDRVHRQRLNHLDRRWRTLCHRAGTTLDDPTQTE
ncbi:hypothetical protein [Nocardia terpenica]|uniref:Uncharacterized protein n=1 Tax=Nocardia terpenica TaxID=455432 RepID=A0A6G9ZDH1_9NOCA|nr:hypothetical protein [Nocardia terpenica]QIS23665.1 hypothetical protein F6W96_40735 [Nocardia terpenica]